MTKRKPILCLDFDGVIHSYTSGWKGISTIPDDPVPGAMEFILAAREEFTVQIFSSRSASAEGILAMQGWLMTAMLRHSLEGGGPHDFGDETIAQVVDSIGFPVTKPPAFLTIDDRAIQFEGTFPAIEKLMMFKPWNKA